MQGDFEGHFAKKSTSCEAGVTTDRDLPYKINNN